MYWLLFCGWPGHLGRTAPGRWRGQPRTVQWRLALSALHLALVREERLHILRRELRQLVMSQPRFDVQADHLRVATIGASADVRLHRLFVPIVQELLYGRTGALKGKAGPAPA
jgi:hypothetical protein